MVYSTVFVFGSLHQFSANKNILGVDSTSQISIHQVAAFNVKNHSVEAAVEMVSEMDIPRLQSHCCNLNMANSSLEWLILNKTKEC